MRNRAVTDSFEPGSVNKIITAAAALETGSVSLDQRFRVPSSMQVGPFTIYDSHVHPIETMTLGRHHRRVEQHRRGPRRRTRSATTSSVRYMQRFGYGQPTGIGFPGEASGVLLPASQWDEVIRATVSYGQGISVTPMQMADVYATIANGGRWVQPRLVRGFEGPDGTFSDAPEHAHPAGRAARPRPIC